MKRNQVLGMLCIGGMVFGMCLSDTVTQIAMTDFYQPLYLVQMAALSQLLWLFFFKKIKWVDFKLLKHTFPLAALWSGATYMNVSSLHYTTLSSNEVLSTLMAPWALLLSVILLRAERYCLVIKVLALIFSFIGAFIITSTDDESAKSKLLGDLLMVSSAICMGSYEVYFRYFIPKDTDVRAILIPIGSVVLIATYPLQYILDISGAEQLARPAGKDLGVLFGAVICGNFLTDFCIANGCLLLSPFLVTIGVSLVVPISIVIDVILHSIEFEWQFIVGTIFTLTGFFLASMTTLESVKNKLDDKQFIRCCVKNKMKSIPSDEFETVSERGV
jgi:drug/metabolite transporter (DMT)-like permease